MWLSQAITAMLGSRPVLRVAIILLPCCRQGAAGAWTGAEGVHEKRLQHQPVAEDVKVPLGLMWCIDVQQNIYARCIVMCIAIHTSFIDPSYKSEVLAQRRAVAIINQCCVTVMNMHTWSTVKSARQQIATCLVICHIKSSSSWKQAVNPLMASGCLHAHDLTLIVPL